MVKQKRTKKKHRTCKKKFYRFCKRRDGTFINNKSNRKLGRVGKRKYRFVITRVARNGKVISRD